MPAPILALTPNLLGALTMRNLYETTLTTELEPGVEFEVSVTYSVTRGAPATYWQPADPDEVEVLSARYPVEGGWVEFYPCDALHLTWGEELLMLHDESDEPEGEPDDSWAARQDREVYGAH